MTKEILNTLYGCNNKFDVTFFGGVGDYGGYLATKYNGEIGVKTGLKELKLRHDFAPKLIINADIDHIILTEHYDRNMIKTGEHWDIMFKGSKGGPFTVDFLEEV